MRMRTGAAPPGAPGRTPRPTAIAPAPTIAAFPDSACLAAPAPPQAPAQPLAWVIGALLVGAVMVVDPAGLAPYGPARWMVISTVGFLGAGLAVHAGRVAIERRFARLWAVLVVFILLGAVFGDDVRVALVGHPDRHFGLMTWVLLVAMFYAGLQLDTPGDRRIIARSGVVALLGLGSWCMWELFIGAPITGGTNTSRLTGPFGSAAMLGAALCVLVPLAAGATIDTRSASRWRVASGVASAMGVITLVGSGTRAAIIGLVVGLGAATLMAGRRSRWQRRTLAFGVLVLIPVIVATAVLMPRFSDAFDRSAGASSRLDEWRVATRVVVNHPAVGVGPEGYRIAVAEGVNAEYERAFSRDRVLPDRAHSGPIDVALIGGIPAALAYLALLALVCWRALSLIRPGRFARPASNPARDPVMAGMAVAVIAYATQQLALFPFAELDPVWWVLAGIVAHHARRQPTTPSCVLPPQRSIARRNSRRLGGSLAFAVSAVALAAGIADVAADRLARTALSEGASVTSNGLSGTDTSAAQHRAIEAAERAVSLRPDNIRYRLIAANVEVRRRTLAGLDAAIAHADRALSWSPLDPMAADSHASFLLERAVITGTQTDIDAALREWTILVERDPVRARWQLQLGRAAALDGDVLRARQAWTAASELAPDNRLIEALLAQLDRKLDGKLDGQDDW